MCQNIADPDYFSPSNFRSCLTYFLGQPPGSLANARWVGGRSLVYYFKNGTGLKRAVPKVR